MAPSIQAFDHIHVYVADRPAAEAWYRQVFGFTRTPGLEFWADDGGPLTIQNENGSVHIALFERPRQACRSTIALRVTAADYRAWQAHLANLMPGKFTQEDHQASLSLYFSDPDGNPYEVTTYEVEAARL